MDSYEKYLFDTSFDPASVRRAAEAQAAAEAEVEEPPPPTFSEEELAEAKGAAFAEGMAAGEAKAEEGIARRTADQLVALTAKLEALAEDLAKRLDDNGQQSALAAMTVVRKLFPRLSKNEGLAEIHAVVEDCLERLREEPRMVVRAADQDLDALKETIEGSVRRSGFNGKLVFLADDRLAPGDVRVEWADGGAERDQAGLWQEIDAIIERTFAAGQKSSGAASATEPAEGRASPAPQPSADIEPLRRAQTA